MIDLGLELMCGAGSSMGLHTSSLVATQPDTMVTSGKRDCSLQLKGSPF